MQRPPYVWLAALTIAAMVSAAWWTRDGEPAQIASPQAAGSVTPTQADAPWPPSPKTPSVAASVHEALPRTAVASAQEPQPKRFRVDSAGKLVVDTQLRSDLEALVSLTAEDQLPAKIESELQGLPVAAAVAARELVQRFDNYQAAQRQTFPPGDAPLVPQDGLAELATLQALRTSYFGAEQARLMFGEEEAAARRLLELMRDDTAPGLSMEQKAMRAQVRFDAERGATPR